MPTKQHIYLIPGMSANCKIYERFKFPKDEFEVHNLEWMVPTDLSESIEDYAQRMCSRITESNPILIGVSFGGVLAQEIAQCISTKQIILLSSLKNPEELSPFLKFVKTTRLYKLAPVSWIPLLEKWILKHGGPKAQQKVESYEKFLSVRNPLYLKWAIKNLLFWKGNTNTSEITHFHGDKDSILPIKNIQNAIPITKGGHAMVLTHAVTLQQKIVELIK